MAEITWLGDADRSVDEIDQYGHHFVKGKPTKVSDDDPFMHKFKNMGVFSVGKGKAETVEPEDDEETAKLKETLDERNIKFRANATKESLQKLVDEDDERMKAALAAQG